MNFRGIYEGYGNALSRKNQQVERLAAARLAVCKRCPHFKTNLGFAQCGQCGCPLAALTRQNHKICQNWKHHNL